MTLGVFIQYFPISSLFFCFEGQRHLEAAEDHKPQE
jgi:hypothetical protein